MPGTIVDRVIMEIALNRAGGLRPVETPMSDAMRACAKPAVPVQSLMVSMGGAASGADAITPEVESDLVRNDDIGRWFANYTYSPPPPPEFQE